MYVGKEGETEYAEGLAQKNKIEEGIGLSLATNGAVPKLAKVIKENCLPSAAPDSSSIASGSQSHKLPEKEKWKIGEFGGAQSIDEDWDTLGGSVFAVMEEIEKDSDIKAEYSISSTQGHPYFPQGAKKPEFDKGLAACSWDELPKHTQSFLGGSTPTVDYNKLTSSTKLNLLHDYRHASEAMQGTVMQLTEKSLVDSALADVKDALKALGDAPQNMILRERLKANIIAIKKDKGGSDAGLDAKLGALLDIVVDKHTSGDYTNMVKRDQNAPQPGKPGNLNEDPWIDDTVKAGKPIISGPSGHTLRYLNFWAEKRDNKRVEQASSASPTSGIPKEWPSLQAARLVMMADLMPPKHHSYDEIMTSSIGITDGVSAPLKYESKSSYLDLAMQGEGDAHDAALQAFTESKAYEIIPNKELDDKFAPKTATTDPRTVTDLEEMSWTDDSPEAMVQRKSRAQSINTRNQSVGSHVANDVEYNAAIERAMHELSELENMETIIAFLGDAKK